MNKMGSGGTFWRPGAYCAFLAVAVAGCADAEPEIVCTDDMLGVARVLEISPDSPPVIDLLNENEIVLTFDDGPDRSRTRKVLSVLDSECTKASFFLLGRAAEKSPELVEELVRRGHSVGGHSYNHANFMHMEVEAATENAIRGNAAISDALEGEPVHMFRFPFVAFDESRDTAIRALGLSIIGVDADGADWTAISVSDSVELIMSRLESNGHKGVILLHDPFSGSDRLVRLLLDRLKTDGYSVVALVPQASEEPIETPPVSE